MTEDLKHQMVVVEKKSVTDNNDHHNKHQEHTQTQWSHHHQKQQQQNSSFFCDVRLQYDPQIPEGGKPTKLAVCVTEQQSGNLIQEFETIHDQLMHLVIVDKTFPILPTSIPHLKTAITPLPFFIHFQKLENIIFG